VWEAVAEEVAEEVANAVAVWVPRHRRDGIGGVGYAGSQLDRPITGGRPTEGTGGPGPVAPMKKTDRVRSLNKASFYRLYNGAAQ